MKNTLAFGALSAGLTQPRAEKLAATLAEVVRNTSVERLALLAKFDGLARIENGQAHPSHKH
jgi:hypothetical protein